MMSLVATVTCISLRLVSGIEEVTVGGISERKMLGNSSSSKELSLNTNSVSLVGGINNVSERVGSSEDGKGSSNFRDSELVTTVGMRTDGCSVTGCIVERNSSDSNEAVEG